MKKYIILLFIIVLSTNLRSQINIQGIITPERPSDSLFLSENIGGKYFKIGTCVLTDNDEYSFEGDFQTGYYSIGLSDTNWAQIIVQPSESNIHIDFNSSNLRKGISVIKSSENQLLWDFMRYRKSIKSNISQAYTNKTYYSKESDDYMIFQKAEDSLTNIYNNYLLNLYQNNRQTFFANTIISDLEISPTEEFFKFTFFQNSNLIRSGVFTRKVTEYLQFHTSYTEDGFIKSIDYILDNASENNKVYEFILNYLLELFNEVGPDIILDYLVEEYVIGDACSDLETSEIIATKLHNYRKLQIGNKAPKVSIFDSKGTMHNLNDLCLFSEINIVFFGSSLCHFCQDAIPKLEDFSLQFEETSLKVIYISLDTNYSIWVNEIKYLPENWISLSELKAWDAKSTELFQIHKTPSFYILDRNSIIISKPKNIDELLNELHLILNNSD